MGQRKEPIPAAVEFGRRMRQRRLELELSQEELADLCGLHFTYVGSVERGERNVSLVNILKIAAGLDVDPGELVARLAGQGLNQRSRRR